MPSLMGSERPLCIARCAEHERITAIALTLLHPRYVRLRHAGLQLQIDTSISVVRSTLIKPHGDVHTS